MEPPRRRGRPAKQEAHLCPQVGQSFTAAPSTRRRFCSVVCVRRTDPKQAPLEERFWRHVEKGDGCWRWTGAVKAHGSGVIMADHAPGEPSQHRHARTVAYEVQLGPVPEGLKVVAACGDKLCVRGDHLKLVPRRKRPLRPGK